MHAVLYLHIVIKEKWKYDEHIYILLIFRLHLCFFQIIIFYAFVQSSIVMLTSGTLSDIFGHFLTCFYLDNNCIFCSLNNSHINNLSLLLVV